MKTVDFDCPHGRVSLSIDQAETLIADLQSELDHARRSGTLIWNYADDNGMINRQQFYQFFEQYIPERTVLRNRAGKLYAAIVRSGMKSRKYGGNPPIPLMVICGSCSKPIISEPSDSDKNGSHTFYRNSVDYLINLHDVYRFQAAFMPHGPCALLGRKLSDFQLLLDNM